MTPSTGKSSRAPPAHELSGENQKRCLTGAHNDGNGQNGLVGYEILDCGIHGEYK
jgi:hypothetical protein